MNLKGCTTLVTGGAHRVGRSIALAFAHAGADVIIHYHNSTEQAQTTQAELRGLGVRAWAIPADLARTADAESLGEQALALTGRLDVLVNNAGIWGPTPIGTVSAERWEQLFGTNLRGAFFLTQRLAPALRAARGAIINIADAGLWRPWRNHTPYLTTKGAMVTMTEALARDLAPEVRVNAIAPGPVLLPNDWDDQRADHTARSVLLQRVGSPDDVGQAAVFLAQADYITGVLLPVDGGAHLA